MSKISLLDALKTSKCWRCRGDGSYFVCPSGMNPFTAGGWNAVRAMRKVDPCPTCRGSGWISAKDSAVTSTVRGGET